MAFTQLVDKGQQLVNIVDRHIWSNLELTHVPWGYETHVSQEIRQQLSVFSADNNITARYIRFSPDFFVVQQKPNLVYLLEYKNSQAPLYSQNRINHLSQLANKPLKSEDIGQWQTAAHDNYKALQSIGVKVAILYYVAYHRRLLLCDFVENVEEIFRDKVRTDTRTGSRTDYINFDVRAMRTFQEFMVDIHGISPESIAPYIQSCCRELQEKLPIERHWRDQRR